MLCKRIHGCLVQCLVLLNLSIYAVDNVRMSVKQALETEHLIDGHWTSVQQFNVVASALLKIVKLINVQMQTTNCH